MESGIICWERYHYMC